MNGRSSRTPQERIPRLRTTATILLLAIMILGIESTISSYHSKKIFAQEDPNSFEICDNFVDDDADGFMDAEDPESCSPAPTTEEEGAVVPETTMTTEVEVCDNFVDDDADGFMDAEDPESCSPAPTTAQEGAVVPEQAVPSAANATTLEICDNFFDDDGDGLTDTDDISDCPAGMELSTQGNETGEPLAPAPTARLRSL